MAALVFRRRAHVINVFVSPSAAGPLPRSEWRGNGYNLVRWADGDFAFSAISDLNAQELDQFTALLGAE